MFGAQVHAVILEEMGVGKVRGPLLCPPAGLGQGFIPVSYLGSALKVGEPFQPHPWHPHSLPIPCPHSHLTSLP